MLWTSRRSLRTGQRLSEHSTSEGEPASRTKTYWIVSRS
jgi:hypothetical protein